MKVGSDQDTAVCFVVVSETESIVGWVRCGGVSLHQNNIMIDDVMVTEWPHVLPSQPRCHNLTSHHQQTSQVIHAFTLFPQILKHKWHVKFWDFIARGEIREEVLHQLGKSAFYLRMRQKSRWLNWTIRQSQSVPNKASAYQCDKVEAAAGPHH